MKKSNSDSYNLDANFECVLVTALCCRPRLFARIGYEINPEALSHPAAQLATKAARAIAFETDNGPDSLILIAQQLRRWFDEGQVRQEEIDTVMDFFDDGEDLGLPEDKGLVDQIAPVLKQKARDSAVHVAIDTLGKRGDMNTVRDLLGKAERIGVVEETVGTGLENFESELNLIRNLVRLPTGIVELDGALGGGPERGSAWCFMGGAKEGKSMALNQVAVHAWLMGLNVVYATLELNKAWTFARIVSNVTGIPIDSLLNGQMEEAVRQMKAFWEDRTPGLLQVEHFTPKVTTLDDIKDWVSRIEDKFGKEIHLVDVDYLDKVVPENKQGSSYVEGGVVFEGYRVWMNDTQKWGWTATQARRKNKDSKKRLEIDDGSDSQHKVRVLDGLITLNKKEEGKEISYFIAANRNGVDEVTVGPLPTDFAHGRIAVVNREPGNIFGTADQGQLFGA
jgi:hypothetical protein